MFMGNEPKPKRQSHRAKKNKAKRDGYKLGKVSGRYWPLRLKYASGGAMLFPTPDDLWEACCDYFQWVEENPLYEEKAFSSKNGIMKTKLSKVRAMTIRALCIHIGISVSGYLVYRKRDEYKWVTDAVDDIIYTQKYEGAAAGLLNSNVIVRDLGLKDEQGHEIKTTDADKSMFDIKVTHVRD